MANRCHVECIIKYIYIQRIALRNKSSKHGAWPSFRINMTHLKTRSSVQSSSSLSGLRIKLNQPQPEALLLYSLLTESFSLQVVPYFPRAEILPFVMILQKGRESQGHLTMWITLVTLLTSELFENLSQGKGKSICYRSGRGI